LEKVANPIEKLEHIINMINFIIGF